MTQIEAADPPAAPLEEKPIWDRAVVARFHEKCERTQVGCWIWRGNFDSHGSPRIWTSGSHGYVYAARVAWEIEHGQKLTRHQRIHPSCPNGKRCVAPDHLLVVVGKRHRSPPQVIVQSPPPTDIGLKIALLIKHLGYTVRNGEQIRAGLALLRRDFDTTRRDTAAALTRVEAAILLQRNEVARLASMLETLHPVPPSEQQPIALPPPAPPPRDETTTTIELSPFAVYYLSAAHDGVGTVTPDDERVIGEVFEAAIRVCDTDHERAIALYMTWLDDYVAITPEAARGARDLLRYVGERT